ncbi:uncharacterized protein LOC119280675 [Triticum dicoccoides]|uniref:uncharacterized protein LOC119280675 n=1 Tax=Triticum dicoccoides TaxID=85692 RepID=UPI00188E8248|nr:uncharacterized protein LOC119280675 [Triticum dicoccoides]
MMSPSLRPSATRPPPWLPSALHDPPPPPPSSPYDAAVPPPPDGLHKHHHHGRILDGRRRWRAAEEQEGGVKAGRRREDIGARASRGDVAAKEVRLPSAPRGGHRLPRARKRGGDIFPFITIYGKPGLFSPIGVHDACIGVRGHTSRADYRQLMKCRSLLEYMGDDCKVCEESGGRCRINTTYDIFECHCSDRISPSTCGTRRERRRLY